MNRKSGFTGAGARSFASPLLFGSQDSDGQQRPRRKTRRELEGSELQFHTCSPVNSLSSSSPVCSVGQQTVDPVNLGSRDPNTNMYLKWLAADRKRDALVKKKGEDFPSINVALGQCADRQHLCERFYRGLDHSSSQEHIMELLHPYGLPPPPSPSPSTCRGMPFQTLEKRHDYIQLLFPLRTPGMNPSAPLLQREEILCMRANPLVLHRVWMALEMMLRFYGIEVRICPAAEEENAAVKKPRPKEVSSFASAPDPMLKEEDFHPPKGGTSETGMSEASTWQQPMRVSLHRWPDALVCREQQRNLSSRTHNFLRITRISWFLGELQWDPVRVTMMRFFAREVAGGGEVPTSEETPFAPPPEKDRDLSNHFSPEEGRERRLNPSRHEAREASKVERCSATPSLRNCESSLVNFWIETLLFQDERDAVMREMKDAATAAAAYRKIKPQTAAFDLFGVPSNETLGSTPCGGVSLPVLSCVCVLPTSIYHRRVAVSPRVWRSSRE